MSDGEEGCMPVGLKGCGLVFECVCVMVRGDVHVCLVEGGWLE